MKQTIFQLLTQFTSKQILIWGIGREGQSTYDFLRTQLPDQKIIISDLQDFHQLPTNVQNKLNQDEYTSYIKQTPKLFDDQSFDVIFKSPGISPFEELGVKALRQVNSFWSNTRLFLELIKNNQNITTIGVTGTKGKSTTAMIIHHLLTTAGKHTYLLGNIGQPALEVVADLIDQSQNASCYPVLELSSHQLLDLSSSPKIAVIQALSPEHLDYYPDVNLYYQAKEAICKFQHPEDMVLFFDESSPAEKIATLSLATRKIGFSLEKNANQLPTESPLKGEHNLVNLIPGVLIARSLDIPDSVIATGVKTLKPLPHRLEFVTTQNGVSYYNDSLSTTPVATIQALESFRDQQIILLAGGYERYQDYQQLAEVIMQQEVPYLILFPTTGERLKTEIETLAQQAHTAPPQIKMVSTMQEAVSYAREKAKPNNIVLLSPAAASFNMFENYEDRGNQFKKYSKLLD